MNAWYDPAPPDTHVPTLGQVGAALGLVLGALTYVAWRARRHR